MINAEIVMKKCTRCKDEFKATADNFYRRALSPDGLNHWCKECMNEYQLQRREKGLDVKQKNRKGPSNARAEQLEGESIDLYEVQAKIYEKGRYKVVYQGGMHNSGTYEFIGKLIDQTKDFITLENDMGIAESFLKIDFQIGNKIKKVA